MTDTLPTYTDIQVQYTSLYVCTYCGLSSAHPSPLSALRSPLSDSSSVGNYCCCVRGWGCCDRSYRGTSFSYRVLLGELLIIRLVFGCVVRRVVSLETCISAVRVCVCFTTGCDK